MKRLTDLTDADAVAYVADAFGQPMAAIYTHDLADWAWILERVGRWLAAASQATHCDYHRFVADCYRPDGPSVGDVAWMVSAMASRMGHLVDGAPS